LGQNSLIARFSNLNILQKECRTEYLNWDPLNNTPKGLDFSWNTVRWTKGLNAKVCYIVFLSIKWKIAWRRCEICEIWENNKQGFSLSLSQSIDNFHREDITENISDQFPTWIFNFGQLRAVRKKSSIMNYELLLSSVFHVFMDKWYFVTKIVLTYHNGICQYCQTLSKSRIPKYTYRMIQRNCP
jgi:hypothetical protein